jgi:hypothetical protein
MLRRLERDGPLLTLAPWEMRTVRSLLERGLVRPRRPGRTDVGLWFLSAKGRRILSHSADAAPERHAAPVRLDPSGPPAPR